MPVSAHDIGAQYPVHTEEQSISGNQMPQYCFTVLLKHNAFAIISKTAKTEHLFPKIYELQLQIKSPKICGNCVEVS